VAEAMEDKPYADGWPIESHGRLGRRLALRALLCIGWLMLQIKNDLLARQRFGTHYEAEMFAYRAAKVV